MEGTIHYCILQGVDVFVTSECIHLYILYFIGPHAPLGRITCISLYPDVPIGRITKSNEEVPSIVSGVISTLVVVTRAYIIELGLLIEPT